MIMEILLICVIIVCISKLMTHQMHITSRTPMTTPTNKIVCDRCKETLFLTYDVRLKIKSCLKSKCPCRKHKFIRRLAETTQLDVCDFVPAIAGSVVINEVRPVPTQTYNWPQHKSVDRSNGGCQYDSNNPCIVGECCRENPHYCG